MGHPDLGGGTVDSQPRHPHSALARAFQLLPCVFAHPVGDGVDLAGGLGKGHQHFGKNGLALAVLEAQQCFRPDGRSARL
jgi:hypothetical protein